MAVLALSSFQINPAVNGGYSTTNLEVRWWYNRGFIDSSTVFVQGGNGQDGFYITSTCTVSGGGIITVPSTNIYSTLDAIDPAPQAIQFFGRLYSNGAPKQWVTAFSSTPTGWVVQNPGGGTITYEELVLENQAIVLANPPSTFWTIAQTEAYIASLTPTPLASDVVIGRSKLSVAPVDALEPIAVGDNDPRMGSWFNIESYGAATTNSSGANSTAITAAVAAASSAGGGIFVPVGTFNTQNVAISVPVMFAPGNSILSTVGNITISKAMIADTSQHFAGAGSISFAGNASLSAVYPTWWQANTVPGTTDMQAAIDAAISAGSGDGPAVVFPAGTYAYATAPNFGLNNLTVQASGKVLLKHTGTGNILTIGDPLSADLVNVQVLGNFQVQGNASSGTDGVVISHITHGSIIELCGRGAPSAMFTVSNSVDAVHRLSVSVNMGTLSPVPTTGIKVVDSTDSEFYVIVDSAVPAITNGLVVQHSSGCRFSGAVESCDTGITENSTCRRNRYDGMDCEGNATLDMQLNGSSTVIFSNYINSVITTAIATAATTQGLVFIGGQIRSINLNASSQNTLFLGVQFPATAGLGVTGTGTYKMIDCTFIDGSGNIAGPADDVVGSLITLQPAPATVTVAALLTLTQLKTRAIEATPPVLGATTQYQVPTGTNMIDSIGAIPINGTLTWSISNLATGALDTATIIANTDHIIVGNPIIQSANAATGGLWGTSQATFQSRRTGTLTWVTKRIG